MSMFLKIFCSLLVFGFLFLVFVIIIGFKQKGKKAEQAQCMLIQKNCHQSVRSYYGFNEVKNPDAPHKIVSVDELIKNGFLKSLPTCPSGGEYIWVEGMSKEGLPVPVMKCSLPEHAVPKSATWLEYTILEN